MAVFWQLVPTSVFAMLFTPDLQDVRLMPSVSSMLLAAAPAAFDLPATEHTYMLDHSMHVPVQSGAIP